MTFLWIDDDERPRRPYGQRRFERRIDERTASDIADAMRARGIQAAAQAMDHLQVDVDVALRVLGGAGKRRDEGRKAAPAPDQFERREPVLGNCEASKDFDPALVGT